VNDGFAGVRSFLKALCSGEDGLIGGRWLGRSITSGDQPTAGAE